MQHPPRFSALGLFVRSLQLIAWAGLLCAASACGDRPRDRVAPSAVPGPSMGATAGGVGGQIAPPDTHLPVPIGPFLNGAFPDKVPSPGDLELIDAFPQISAWVDPIDLRAEPGSNRLWVAEIGGRIWSVEDDRAATQRELVADLRSRVFQNDRGGLLGFVFHPDWGQANSPNRRYVYVFYQWAPALVQVDDMQPWSWAHYRRVSRFEMPVGETAIDPATELVLIQQYTPSLLHAGGGMFFGLDGFLYIASGDDGRFWDYEDHTQCIDKGLFSGILRIDVDRDPTRSHPIRRQPVDFHATLPTGWPASATAGYFVPDDNPWLDVGGTVLEEFWALGLRSPHRMSQDPLTGDVWFGDVGQNTREEVSLARAGDNLQWPFMEGTFALFDRPAQVIGREVGPVFDYGRTIGSASIGGQVYRGTALPELVGLHVSADNVQGRVFATSRQGFPQEILSVPGNTSEFFGTSSINVDHRGEILICRWNGPRQSGGKVFKLVRKGIASIEPPARLSQVGAFTDLAALTPVGGLRPYEINAPFWSDDALKTRFVAIPNDGTHDTNAERIGYSEEGEWQFPAGTVLVKHFELPLDFTVPNPPTRRLETRFMVKTSAGEWYGITYRWRPDGTDADLLADGMTEQFSVQTQGGPEVRTWDYPSRNQCLQCHNANAGFALGLSTRQLNRPALHPVSGAPSNQVAIWDELGMFDPPIDRGRLAQLPRMAAIDDATAPLERRMRSYFDANCAYCHRPGGVFGALFDARFATPLAEQGIVGGAVYDERGIPGAKVVQFGDPVRSLALGRIGSVVPGVRMPPIAKNRVHAIGMAALLTWIQQAEGVADFTANARIGPPGLQASFTDTSTVVGTAWRWDFGDGTSATVQNPTHVYPAPGRYDVTLEVTAPSGTYEARRGGWIVVGDNLAVNATVTQSSTINGAVADRAIDGNTDGDPGHGSITETDFEQTPWWQADLGSVMHVSAIRIWNRTIFGREWLSQFVVFFSDVPFTSTDLETTRAQPGVRTIAVGPMVDGSLELPVDQSARYVRIQSELWTNLSMAEVELFGAPLTAVSRNIAIGKTATQSSVDPSAPDLGATNAIDGDLAGSLLSGSLAQTTRQSEAWWHIDLGASFDLERVVLWNRTDCCSERLANFHVIVSDEPFASTGLAATLAQTGVWNYRHAGSASRRTELAVGRSGRYLRVQLAGREHLALAEVQVFARATPVTETSLTLGNLSSAPVWTDPRLSNLVIGYSDLYTNVSAVPEQLRIDTFGFVAGQLADPVTPFVARMDGPGQFTVLAIGTTRAAGEYAAGDNRFSFADGVAPQLTVQPGEKLVAGFLDAAPDGTGGGAGSVVSFDTRRPLDSAWHTGGRSASDSGSITVGQPPVPGRRTFEMRRNYHFRIDVVRL